MMTVSELLISKNIVSQQSGQSILIKCLNPAHEDNNPSMRINATTGDSHCFACGHSVNIYRHFGIQLNKVNTKVFKLLAKLDKRRNPSIELPEGNTPIIARYRDISIETLKHFEAFHNMLYFKDRICIPIRGFDNNIKCFITRDMYSNESRYLVYPKGARPSIFPIRPSITNKTLVIVEGIFDTIKAYDCGMKNVICTFGTSAALVKTTIEAIVSTANLLGCTRLVLALDNDKAGANTTEKLIEFLESRVPSIEVFNWEKLTTLLGKEVKDFGELSKEDFFSVQAVLYTNEKGGQ
jgi:DNA primase